MNEVVTIAAIILYIFVNLLFILVPHILQRALEIHQKQSEHSTQSAR